MSSFLFKFICDKGDVKLYSIYFDSFEAYCWEPFEQKSGYEYKKKIFSQEGFLTTESKNRGDFSYDFLNKRPSKKKHSKLTDVKMAILYDWYVILWLLSDITISNLLFYYFKNLSTMFYFFYLLREQIGRFPPFLFRVLAIDQIELFSSKSNCFISRKFAI